MDRKIYARVTARIPIPCGVSHKRVEEEIDWAITASPHQAADFEDVEVREASWTGNTLHVSLRVVIRADDELTLEAVMTECWCRFSLDDHKLASELTGWEADDSK